MATNQRNSRPTWTVVGLLTSIAVAAGAIVVVMKMDHGSATPTPVVQAPAGSGATDSGVSAMGFMQHPDGNMAMAGTTMPDYATTSPDLEAMYRFAMDNGELVSYMPCTCGCAQSGHMSLWNCFVQRIDASGKVTFSDHATGCQICQDILRDVIDMDRRGSPPIEIRKYLDEHYPGTQTPTEYPPAV